MKQNLANRLAAGGFWAIQMGVLSVEITRRMREDGLAPPVGSGSDTEVFVACSVDAFQMFCNINMDTGRMAVNFEQVVAAARGPQMYDKACRPITLEQWSALQEDINYKRVALWEHNGWHVSTVWTGVDANGCADPHIFESLVVSVDAQHGPRIRHIFRYHNIHEAALGHNQIVNMIRGMGI